MYGLNIANPTDRQHANIPAAYKSYEFDCAA
jgi:hypothetical protein